jgi:membrane-bound lytic murein transglycosylase D
MLRRLQYFFCGALLIFALLVCPSQQLPLAQNPVRLQENVWEAMADRFELGNAQYELVQEELSWFSQHQNYVTELTRNSSPFIYYVLKQTLSRGMPAEIALIPMIESNYRPGDISTAGAAGFWQLLQTTAQDFGIKTNSWYDGRRDIVASTEAALNYIAYLHGCFGSWLLAMAAYDAGEGTVAAAIKHNQALHKPTDFWHLSLPQETRLYIPKILAMAAIIGEPESYHLHLHPVQNKAYFEPVPVKGGVSLDQVARVTQTDIREIKKLNAGLISQEVAPLDSYALLLPTTKAPLLKEHLQAVQAIEPSSFTHKVSLGESIYSIASRFAVKPAQIIAWNHLSHPGLLQPGQKLKIYWAKASNVQLQNHHLS